jgi:predicted transcriptional regulator
VIILKNEKLNLSNAQQEFLTTVVDLYQKKGCALKIAELVESTNNSSHGTIRNLIQTMKTFGLVKCIPGLGGGYLPTKLAYKILGSGQDAKVIPIYRNEELSDVTLQELRLKPPSSSILHVLGDIRDFNVGDRIKIASKNLIISGRVEGRNEQSNTLISSIDVAFLIK